MPSDARVLLEAERWFRAILRGRTSLREPEASLFAALASRQNAQGEIYVPRDNGTPQPPPLPCETLPTTRPPPADIQNEWLRLSKQGPGPARLRKVIVAPEDLAEPEE